MTSRPAKSLKSIPLTSLPFHSSGTGSEATKTAAVAPAGASAGGVGTAGSGISSFGDGGGGKAVSSLASGRFDGLTGWLLDVLLRPVMLYVNFSRVFGYRRLRRRVWLRRAPPKDSVKDLQGI